MIEYWAKTLDATYGALAHDVRRSMLEDLRDGEARVTDLAAPFDISLAAASKHIVVLEHAGLVRRNVIGREHRLSLDAAPLASASEWLEPYRRFWTGRLDALERHLREREP
jgi:DNA-binding transcriptional ArsR family regulator